MDRQTHDIIEILHWIKEHKGCVKYYKDTKCNNEVDIMYLTSTYRTAIDMDLNIWDFDFGIYYKTKKYNNTKII